MLASRRRRVALLLGAAALHVHGRKLGVVCCTLCYSSDARRLFHTITDAAGDRFGKINGKARPNS